MAEKVGEIYYDVTLDTAQMIDGSRKVQRETERLETRFNAVAAAVAAMAAAMAAVKLAMLADEFRLLGARVEVAAGSIEGGAAAMDALSDISRRTQSSLAGNIEVFTRLNQSIKQMGGTQADTLQLTELLAKAIKVSGASAVEAKAAMLQFGQALGSGKLAGDELRSLLETAPYLMRQLADGIGVPVGALRKMGEEGKLTADVVTNALSKAATQIDADFKKFPQTIESAMVVARDQAALAALKFDDLTGSSSALTGAAKGLGEVFEQLAGQFARANGGASSMSKNEAVSMWANATRFALSLVTDALDVLVRAGPMALSIFSHAFATAKNAVEEASSTISGRVAQAWELARGNFVGAKAIGDAMEAESAARRKRMEKADAEFLAGLKLSGQKMRDAWAMPDLGQSDPTELARRRRLPSKLTTPPAPKADKFDDAGYLAGLEKSATEGFERINAIEREALRKNQKLLEEGKISRKTAADAITLIERDAALERTKLLEQQAEQNKAYWDKVTQTEMEAAQRKAEQQRRDLDMAREVMVANDPIARLQQELQTKSDMLAAAAERDRANEEIYQAARVKLEQDTAAAIMSIHAQSLAGYSSTLEQGAEMVAKFGGKQTALYKTMFAASKAFAIAESIIKIQQGIAGAAALPFPANIPAIGAVVAATSGIISTISGTTFGGGRQWGGPVSSGSMYRINEAGAPEMFTGSNGRQYMLPTQAGKVTPADKVGGAPQWTVNVYEAPPGTKVAIDNEARIVSIAVAQAEANFVDQVGNNSGPMWGAMRGATNIQARNL